jgi:uncharacterized spore protein YtfJ
LKASFFWEDKMTEDQPVEETTEKEKAEFSSFSVDTIQNTMDKFLATANVTAVYAKPVRQGDTTIITCSEVFAGLAFGVGEGSGKGNDGERGSGAGGGWGGRTFARPVAAIVASPEGVTIKPIIDTTKIGLAALTTLGFMFAMMGRMGRMRRR